MMDSKENSREGKRVKMTVKELLSQLGYDSIWNYTNKNDLTSNTYEELKIVYDDFLTIKPDDSRVPLIGIRITSDRELTLLTK
jgi:hypothetical protein